MSKTRYKCHCKVCPTETNLNEALRTLNTIGGLGRLCISTRDDISRSYKMELFRYLEKMLDFVTILKENNCKKWEKYWYDAAVHLHTIGIRLQQQQDTEMLLIYLQKFARSLLELEGFQSQIIRNAYLTSALDVIFDCHFENQEFDKCLMVSALGVIASECPKTEINRWMRAKAGSRDTSIGDDTELQELTLVSACQKYEKELQAYLPRSGLDLSVKRKIELLVYELKIYSAKWPSKVPMSAVFRELSQLASTRVSAEVFIDVWGEANLWVHESVPKLLQDTIKKVEIDDFPKRTLILSHLYFLQHKYRVKDTIAKHCDEMEKTLSITKTSHANDRKDPNDECDLVSSYECLKLSKYIKMMKELNKSLDLSSEWIKSTSTDDKDKDRLYKLLSKIGHEFALHGHSVKSLQAWESALTVARILDNPLYILQATGFIIEIADIRKTSNLIREAEARIEDLQDCKEHVVLYFLCKSTAYFYTDFDTSYAAFRQALHHYQSHKSTHLLNARINLLHHKFNTLPCNYQVEGHREYSLVRIHEANVNVNSHYSSNPTTSSYDMRVFFEIYESLIEWYHSLKLPRELRCYAKDVILIAQEMVLPLRTASLLYYLIFADISTCRLDDCRVKLKDFSDMLGLTKSKLLPNTPTQVLKQDIMKDIVNNLVFDFQEMMLDVPTKVVRSTASGSPTFVSENFKLPSFLNHDDTCDCFYCTCIEYHDLVLKKTLLSALLYELEGNFAAAKDFFFGCVKIHEFLKNKERNYRMKMSKRVSEDLVPIPCDLFQATYRLALMEYANFLIRRGKHREAEVVNKKILHWQGSSLRHIDLQNEILYQRLNIILKKQQIENTKPLPLLSVDSKDFAIKTPPSGRSSVTVSPSYVPASTEPVKIAPKSLKFDFSDDEEEEKPKKQNLPKLIPPMPSSGAKTPAPSSSKVKIYTQSKSTKKSKVLLEIPPFKEPEAKVCTPSVSTKDDKTDSNKHLASRTKLLTERLRSSTRKASSSSVKNEENMKDRRVAVRQNLMNQMEGNDDEETGAIRRSARNRK